MAGCSSRAGSEQLPMTDPSDYHDEPRHPVPKYWMGTGAATDAAYPGLTTITILKVVISLRQSSTSGPYLIITIAQVEWLAALV